MPEGMGGTIQLVIIVMHGNYICKSLNITVQKDEKKAVSSIKYE